MNVSDNEDYLDGTLAALIPRIGYKPHWEIYLAHEKYEDGTGGWHLFIISFTPNSLKPSNNIRVRHGFLVPAASYNAASWEDWIFQRCRDVETHEAGEFFTVDGVRRFAPHHSNGENPYIVWHHGDSATAAKKSGDD